jgi:hypothetical protein
MHFLTSHTPVLSTLVIAVALAGCASGVTRMDGPSAGGAVAAAPAVDKTIKSVTLWLNDDAKKLLPDNLKFNADTLKGTIDRALAAHGAVKPDSAQQLDVEITGFRVRSNFSAIMFGFMAGNDNVEGIVTLKDGTGKVLKRSKVSASYALGGIGGGQDDARMGWLYEEFAKHAAAEVIGTPVK